MALSGRVLGAFSSGLSYYQPYLFWEIQSQSVADCSSKVYIEFGHYKAGSSTASYNITASTKLTAKIDGSTVANGVNAPFDFRNAAIGTYNKIWSTTITVQHDTTTGAKSLPISFTHVTGISLATGTVSATVELEPIARASSVAAVSSSVVAGNSFSVTMSRKNTEYHHKATFTAGLDELAVSEVFAESLSYTIPMEWLNYSGGLTNTVIQVSIQTYSDKTCTEKIGEAVETSFTVTAPDSAGPIVEDGWAVAQYDNSGTAAAAIPAYVQGFSRVAVTFDESKIKTQYGAEIKSFSIAYNGKTVSKAPYTTAIISATKVSVVCTVTDTRRISRSVTLEIELYPYSAPTLTDVQIYRASSTGSAAEEGTTIWAVATLKYSNIGGYNSCSLKGFYRLVNGEYPTAGVDLQSGAGAAITNAAEITRTYIAKIVATDALGKIAEYEDRIASANVTFTAMDGGRKGAAFFKYADREDYLETDSNFAVTGDLEVQGHIQPVLIQDADDPGCWYRMIEGEKEWINPRVRVGVEYRTTERHASAPVYTKLVDCLTTIAGGVRTVDITSGLAIIRYAGYGFGSTGLSTAMPYKADSETDKLYANVRTTNIEIHAGTNMGGYNIRVQIWYVKA